jgi:hypothetical protein
LADDRLLGIHAIPPKLDRPVAAVGCNAMSEEAKTDTTKAGTVLSDTDIEATAGEAEQGDDATILKRPRGRPMLGAASTTAAATSRPTAGRASTTASSKAVTRSSTANTDSNPDDSQGWGGASEGPPHPETV